MLKTSSIALAVFMALASTSALSDTPQEKADKAQRKADLAKAQANYDKEKKSCKGMKGDDKTACQKQADADLEKAKADIDASH